MPDRVPLRDVDLRQVDLNLLVPLGVLLRHQHISRAARELGLSQPAMSRALGRLRELFDDELLVPAGGSLRLTPRAQALRPVLERALGQVMQLFDDAPFDPASATGEVCIAMVDVLAYKLLPHLLAVFDRRAPSLRLRVRDWEADFHSHLARGEVELTFGHPRGNEPGIYQQKLISVDWACVLRRAHPALQQAWDLDTFCGLKHALVTTTPQGHGGGQVDEALQALGRSREIFLRVPYAGISPFLVGESDLALTTSLWFATKLAAAAGLEVRRPPFPVPAMPLPIVWHERTHRDPRARWVRSLVAEAAGRVPDAMLHWPQASS